MGTMRFASLFIIGLVAIVVGSLPLGVAEADPCATGTGAVIAPPIDRLALRNPPPVVAHSADPWGPAALKGCRDLPSLITPGNSKLLGFDKPEDASLAEIGAGFEIYVIELDAIRAYTPGQAVTPLLKQLISHIYPLSVKGVVRSSLVVSNRSNQFITTVWGLKKLIKLVTDTHKKDPEFGFVVWIPALNLHLLGDHHDETLKLKPLATRTLYGLVEGEALPAAIVFGLLAQEARAHDERNPG